MSDHRSPAGAQTVRDATLDVFRRLGMTTIFANPGSTEVPFLAGLPDDIGGVVAFLCTEDAGWINAQRIEVSGGMNL